MFEVGIMPFLIIVIVCVIGYIWEKIEINNHSKKYNRVSENSNAKTKFWDNM